MNSSPPSDATSVCEVTNITRHGFWLLVDDHEYFVPFADYATVQAATVLSIYAVERVAPDQLYWPELDVDIDLRALEHPEAYPLVFKGSPQDG